MKRLLMELAGRALRFGPGFYALQAAIAAVHSDASRAAETDWPRVVALYGELAEITGSPVVQLNQAAAVAMAGDVEGALATVDNLQASGQLAGYHLLHSARGDLLRRLGRLDEAALSYERALELATNPVERSFLERRLRECRAART